eukprot:7362732-Prymnesium_polylepis.1
MMPGRMGAMMPIARRRATLRDATRASVEGGTTRAATWGGARWWEVHGGVEVRVGRVVWCGVRRVVWIV